MVVQRSLDSAEVAASGTGSGRSPRADPVDIASRRYYWKPMAALSKSVELEIHRQARVHIPEPCLDLGCGDGRTCDMLQEMGELGTGVLGLDYARGELTKAAGIRSHRALVQGTALSLPFPDGTFACVLAHAVLMAIPDDPSPAIAEIARVVRPGGLVIASVPTDAFVDVLLLPRLIARLSPSLARGHVEEVTRRTGHVHSYPTGRWVELFQRNGFDIERREEYFSEILGRPWSFLVWKGWRVAGLLKLVPGRAPARALAAICAAGIRSTVRREMAPDRPHRKNGFVLFVFRRRAS